MRYGYTGGDPVNRVDPTGLTSYAQIQRRVTIPALPPLASLGKIIGKSVLATALILASFAIVGSLNRGISPDDIDEILRQLGPGGWAALLGALALLAAQNVDVDIDVDIDVDTDTDEDDDYLYFVHGTTTALWSGGYESPLARGQGDFGLGFYVFEDNQHLSRLRAREWAEMKSAEGGTPLVLRYRLHEDSYYLMSEYSVPNRQIGLFVNQYSPNGLTGYDITKGCISKRGNQGVRECNFRYPEQ